MIRALALFVFLASGGVELEAILPEGDPLSGWVRTTPLSVPVVDDLRDADLGPVLQVFVDGEDLPAMAGEVSLEGDRLVFRPRFPLRADLAYVARLALPGEAPAEFGFRTPKATVRPRAAVTRILPATPEIPANLLRFYIEFSRPMGEGDVLPFLELLDERGRRIEQPFVTTPPLWDPDRRRLTLLCHPGRIKRGLDLSDTQGPPLASTSRVTLRVTNAIPDADGQPLVKSFERSWRVVAADRESPDPEQWRLGLPAVASREALRWRSDDFLDAVLLDRMIQLQAADGSTIAGIWSADADGRGAAFRPDDPWTPGEVYLVADGALEDLAGNRIDAPFEITGGAPVSVTSRLVLGIPSAPPAVRFVPLASPTTASLRAIAAVSDDVAWVGGSDGWLGRTLDAGESWEQVAVSADADTLDFRDLHAFDAERVVVMSAGPGSSSRILRTDDAGATWIEVYRNQDPDGFLNAIAFWDERRGLAVGDPVGGRLFLLRTEDGGQTWTPLPDAQRPPTLEGEYGFAASGTNLAVDGTDGAWIVTGGSNARALHSTDAGQTWSVETTPMVHGASSTGIFSVAVRDGAVLLVGGDYLHPERVDTINLLRRDGDAWRAGVGQPFHSCVRFVPQRTDTAIALGRVGSHFSTDAGATWSGITTDGYFTLDLATSRTGFAAGARGRIARVELR